MQSISSDLQNKQSLSRFFTFANMLKYQVVDAEVLMDVQEGLEREIPQMDLSQLSILSMSLKQAADDRHLVSISPSLLDTFCLTYRNHLTSLLKTPSFSPRQQQNISNLTYCLFRFCG